MHSGKSASRCWRPSWKAMHSKPTLMAKTNEFITPSVPFTVGGRCPGSQTIPQGFGLVEGGCQTHRTADTGPSNSATIAARPFAGWQVNSTAPHSAGKPRENRQRVEDEQSRRADRVALPHQVAVLLWARRSRTAPKSGSHPKSLHLDTPSRRQELRAELWQGEGAEALYHLSNPRTQEGGGESA